MPYVTSYMNSNLSITIRVCSNRPPPSGQLPLKLCFSRDHLWEREKYNLPHWWHNQQGYCVVSYVWTLAFIRLINNENNLKWQPLSTWHQAVLPSLRGHEPVAAPLIPASWMSLHEPPAALSYRRCTRHSTSPARSSPPWQTSGLWWGLVSSSSHLGQTSVYFPTSLHTWLRHLHGF